MSHLARNGAEKRGADLVRARGEDPSSFSSAALIAELMRHLGAMGASAARDRAASLGIAGSTAFLPATGPELQAMQQQGVNVGEWAHGKRVANGKLGGQHTGAQHADRGASLGIAGSTAFLPATWARLQAMQQRHRL